MLPFSRRRWLVGVFGLFLSISVLPAADHPSGADAYTLIDNDSGHVLETYKGDKRRQIASLTKVATAMVVLDWAAANKKDLGQWAVVPGDSGKVASSSGAGLLPGDFVSIRDLLYCALLQSDNVAAYTLAKFVGHALDASSSQDSDLGDEGVFVAQMNALARKLGMPNTLFLNPHGLEPTKGVVPFSTSTDLAVLSRYAMADKGFGFYVSQTERKIVIMRNLQPLQYLLKNTNEMLGQEGVDGVKTGRTSRAGDCLILSSVREPQTREENGKIYVTPRRVTVVLLGATDRFAVGRQLLSRAWQLESDWAAAGRPRS